MLDYEKAQEVLKRLATITAKQGLFFFTAGLNDDWDAALNWIDRQLSYTPAEAAAQRQRETIDRWRELYTVTDGDLTEALEAINDLREVIAWLGLGVGQLAPPPGANIFALWNEADVRAVHLLKKHRMFRPTPPESKVGQEVHDAG